MKFPLIKEWISIQFNHQKAILDLSMIPKRISNVIAVFVFERNQPPYARLSPRMQPYTNSSRELLDALFFF